MASTLYPKWKEALLNGGANAQLNGTVKAVLVDTADVTYNAAHDFYDDISAGAVGTPQTIGTKTFVNGLFDGDNVTFAALSGDSAEAVVVFVDTGVAATSRLVAWIDSATGLPVTPNSGDVVISWNASGIFQL